MSLTLDPAIEQRIQKTLAATHFRAPSDLLAHALDLVEAEGDWLFRNREAIKADLEESSAQAERGKGYTEDELRGRMAARRIQHPLARIA